MKGLLSKFLLILNIIIVVVLLIISLSLFLFGSKEHNYLYGHTAVVQIDNSNIIPEYNFLFIKQDISELSVGNYIAYYDLSHELEYEYRLERVESINGNFIEISSSVYDVDKTGENILGMATYKNDRLGELMFNLRANENSTDDYFTMVAIVALLCLITIILIIIQTRDRILNERAEQLAEQKEEQLEKVIKRKSVPENKSDELELDISDLIERETHIEDIELESRFDEEATYQTHDMDKISNRNDRRARFLERNQLTQYSERDELPQYQNEKLPKKVTRDRLTKFKGVDDMPDFMQTGEVSVDEKQLQDLVKTNELPTLMDTDELPMFAKSSKNRVTNHSVSVSEQVKEEKITVDLVVEHEDDDIKVVDDIKSIPRTGNIYMPTKISEPKAKKEIKSLNDDILPSKKFEYDSEKNIIKPVETILDFEIEEKKQETDTSKDDLDYKLTRTGSIDIASVVDDIMNQAKNDLK